MIPAVRLFGNCEFDNDDVNVLSLAEKTADD